MTSRTITVLVALSLLVSGCGRSTVTAVDASGLPELRHLSETYGCGAGFWIGNRAQTMALRVAFVGEGELERMVELPSDDWRVSFLFGRDLYANWCDDVVEPDEPTPIVTREYEIVAGSLEIEGDIPERFGGGSLTVHATDLSLILGNGTRVDLGDVTITNESYGFLAG
jgi:hypothetical protein